METAKLCWICEKNPSGDDYMLCKLKHKHYRPCSECMEKFKSMEGKVSFSQDEYEFLFNYTYKLIAFNEKHKEVEQ
jgi:hypothetical protein